MQFLTFWPRYIRGLSRTIWQHDAPKESSGAVCKTLALQHSRLFAVYKAMRQRCYDRDANNYDRYGGRGIRVCKRWRGERGFENFLADMGEPSDPELSIERTNNDGNYTPANCRWATRQEQGRNKRNNRHVDYLGERHLLIELAEEHGIPYKVLHQRVVHRGWSVQRALTQPLKEPPQLDREGATRHHLVELAKAHGNPYKVLHQRHVQRGWPLARALAEPMRPPPGQA